MVLDPILEGVVALPQAHIRMPLVDADDIAEVAVEVFMNDKHNGQIYELTGPELISFKEAVERIANASGRDIKFIPVSLEEYSIGIKGITPKHG